MDMEQWARVRRKVLLDGQSKRSVMSDEIARREKLASKMERAIEELEARARQRQQKAGAKYDAKKAERREKEKRPARNAPAESRNNRTRKRRTRRSSAT